MAEKIMGSVLVIIQETLIFSYTVALGISHSGVVYSLSYVVVVGTQKKCTKKNGGSGDVLGPPNTINYEMFRSETV